MGRGTELTGDKITTIRTLLEEKKVTNILLIRSTSLKVQYIMKQNGNEKVDLK